MREEFYARKIVDENGEEIIELDLNKPLSRQKTRYGNYMGDVDRVPSKRPRKNVKEFITILN